MSVKDIERAIEQLPASDLAELSRWFEEFRVQAREESLLQEGRTYDVWSPLDAHGAAATLQSLLAGADDAGRQKP